MQRGIARSGIQFGIAERELKHQTFWFGCGQFAQGIKRFFRAPTTHQCEREAVTVRYRIEAGSRA